MKRIIFVIGVVLLATAASFASVWVTSPTPNSTNPSSVHVSGTSQMASPVTTMQVYIDGVKKAQVSGASVNTYISLGSGSHQLVIQSWDTMGRYLKSTAVYFKVGTASASTGSTSVSAPTGAKVYGSIDQISGWSSCGACAGIGGNGPVVPYSYTQGRTSPSMDGKSMQFWLGGSKPYSQALWWKQLGANSGVSHFIYDVYFYYNDAAAPQALEFDVNQSVGGKKYIFGTQCSPRGSKTWDVWDNINAKWMSTGIACPAPPVNKWNHLVWEFDRANGKVHYIAVTLNGVRHYINRYYSPRSVSASELNVAFQMDGNYQQKNYSVWLDKVTLKAW